MESISCFIYRSKTSQNGPHLSVKVFDRFRLRRMSSLISVFPRVGDPSACRREGFPSFHLFWEKIVFFVVFSQEIYFLGRLCTLAILVLTFTPKRTWAPNFCQQKFTPLFGNFAENIYLYEYSRSIIWEKYTDSWVARYLWESTVGWIMKHSCFSYLNQTHKRKGHSCVYWKVGLLQSVHTHLLGFKFNTGSCVSTDFHWVPLCVKKSKLIEWDCGIEAKGQDISSAILVNKGKDHKRNTLQNVLG